MYQGLNPVQLVQKPIVLHSNLLDFNSVSSNPKFPNTAISQLKCLKCPNFQSIVRFQACFACLHNFTIFWRILALSLPSFMSATSFFLLASLVFFPFSCRFSSFYDSISINQVLFSLPTLAGYFSRHCNQANSLSMRIQLNLEIL